MMFGNLIILIRILHDHKQGKDKHIQTLIDMELALSLSDDNLIESALCNGLPCTQSAYHLSVYKFALGLIKIGNHHKH